MTQVFMDEMNDADGVQKQNSTTLRLGRMDSQDLHGPRNRRSDSMASDYSDVGTGFIKKRMGSNISLPDGTLLEMEEQSYGHRRGDSLDSRMGYQIDHGRLIADIRQVLVEDVRSMMNRETTSTNEAQPEYLESIEEKLERLLELKRKSVDLSEAVSSPPVDFDQFEESLRIVLRKEVLE